MAKAKKPSGPKIIRHHTDLPGAAEAANLALVILGACGVTRWTDLAADPSRAANVQVTEYQQQLLGKYADILPYLNRTTKVSVYACAMCDRFAFINDGQPPARCNLTLGCSGRPVRATMSPPSAAKNKPADDSEAPRT